MLVVCASQMVGGIVAAAIVHGLTPGDLMVSATLAPGVSRTRGLFIEMFAMAALTLSVLMLAAGEWELAVALEPRLTYPLRSTVSRRWRRSGSVSSSWWSCCSPFSSPEAQSSESNTGC